MSEFKNKTKEELTEMIKTKKSEYETVTQDIIKGKEKNIMKIKLIRKDIARINTAISLLNKEIKKEEQNA